MVELILGDDHACRLSHVKSKEEAKRNSSGSDIVISIASNAY
jgi:hypothetical protein